MRLVAMLNMLELISPREAGGQGMRRCGVFFYVSGSNFVFQIYKNKKNHSKTYPLTFKALSNPLKN